MPTNNAPVSWFQTSEIESEVKTAKLSGFVGCNFPPPPQQFADFVDGLRHIVVRCGLGADPVLFHFRVKRFESLQRKKDAIIVRIFSTRQTPI